LHRLLNITEYDQLLIQPWVGASWEGYVIEQILGHLGQEGLSYGGPYFFRTHDGYEADLVLELAEKRYVFEIKLSASASLKDLHKLRKVGEMIDADHHVLLTKGDTVIRGDDSTVTHLPGAIELVLNAAAGKA
jgi:hypothetical protein